MSAAVRPRPPRTVTFTAAPGTATSSARAICSGNADSLGSIVITWGAGPPSRCTPLPGCGGTVAGSKLASGPNRAAEPTASADNVEPGLSAAATCGNDVITPAASSGASHGFRATPATPTGTARIQDTSVVSRSGRTFIRAPRYQHAWVWVKPRAQSRPCADTT